MDEIRLQKALSEYGIMSRRAAERLMEEGKIKVNGNIALPGTKIVPNQDAIEIDGKKVELRLQKAAYIMLNKPRGYVTTVSDEKGRPTVMDLLDDVPVRVYPVGRLDFDSEGLLLFTNDGDFANKLMHPSYEKEKTYLVSVSHYSDEGVDKLRSPMNIDGYRIKPAKVKILEVKGERAELEIKIGEGRNRQIRKMCDQVGMRVVKLKRTAIGKVILGNLGVGKWRYLSKEEQMSLLNARR